MKKMLLLTVAASVSLLAAASTQEFVYTGSLQQKNFSTHEMPALNTGRSIVRPVSSVKLKRSASAVRPLADAAVLSASYKFPGYYYGYGELDDGTGYMDFLGKTDISSMHGPAYTDVTFENTSTGATQYTWTYQDPSQGFQELTSTDEDLTLNYTWSAVDFPKLTASNGTETDTYTAGNMIATFGGSPAIPYSQTQSLLGYVTPANVPAANGLLGGIGRNSGKAGLGTYGMLIPKPAAPYAISMMYVYAACEFPAGTELYADVYSIDDDNNMSEEPIATAYFQAEQAYENTADDPEYTSVFMVPFVMIEDDGIMVTQTIVNVNSAIAIIMRDNANVTTFDPLVIEGSMDADNFFLTEDDEGGMSTGGIYFDIDGVEGPTENDYSATAVALYIDATFGWFFPESDRVQSTEWEDVVTAETTGETITIPFNSYYISDLTTVQVWSEDGTVDWVDYTLENGEQSVDLTLTVDALPAGVSGRKCTLIFTPTGSAQYKLVIGQGTVGVEDVVATSAANVTVQGGNFVVSAPESINAVTVYNVAGQAVATSEIAGTTTVDAQSLAKGVYVLRFNDGSTVKVIK